MLDCDPKETPMAAGTKLSKDMEATPAEINNYPYRSLVACVLFLSLCTRPDIAFTVMSLSRFLERPGPAMVKCVKRLIRYLKGTRMLGLRYSNSNNELLGGLFKATDRDFLCTFSDADWAADSDTRKSVAAMVTMMSGAAISWWPRLRIHGTV